MVNFIQFFAAQLIAWKKLKRHRTILLFFAVGGNLLLLLYFKYVVFLFNNLISILNIFNYQTLFAVPNVLLPIGISFYTFQAISYVVDVYRNDQKPTRNFFLFGCYISFFPQLIAGPILRAEEVMTQLLAPKKIRAEFVSRGIRLVIFGLFLKVVLADNLSPLVDESFSVSAELLGGLDVLTMSFLFGYQIYFDFAGYSMIAIGCASLFGLKFPNNFYFPYAACSPREFWQRWHITLSSWIRDYLYAPLCRFEGKKRSTGGLEIAHTKTSSVMPLLLTWGLMGLWHGASWNFLLWGLYHGCLVLVWRAWHAIFRKKSKSRFATLGWLVTLPLIMLGWIPFWSQNVQHTLELYSRLFDLTAYGSLGFRENYYLIAFVTVGMFLVCFWATVYLQKNRFMKKRFWRICDVLIVFVCVCLVLIFFIPVEQFIYFQF